MQCETFSVVPDPPFS